MLIVYLDEFLLLFLNRVNDCLVKANDIDFTNVSSEFANQAIQGSNFISLVSHLICK